MADFTPPPSEPSAGWHNALAALPVAEPPAGGWSAIARRLDARRRRRRWMLPLAAAAVLALAIVPAWLSQPTHAPQPGQATPPVAVAQQQDAANSDAPALEQLQAESARLEALLRYARDGRVASGTAAVLAARFDAQLAAVDSALMQPGLDAAQQARLWRDRVEVLRVSAGFESTRRWLATRGEHYDAALARVD